MTKSEAQANFQRFVDEIPNCIAVAKQLLGKETLEYTVEEIKTFELLYLKYYKNPEEVKLQSDYFKQVFESYIGTAFMWHLGGKWEVALEKRYDSFGRIYIEEYGGRDKKGRLYEGVSINVSDWREILEDGEFEGGIHGMIANDIHYYSLTPEYTLEPVRNLN